MRGFSEVRDYFLFTSSCSMSPPHLVSHLAEGRKPILLVNDPLSRPVRSGGAALGGYTPVLWTLTSGSAVAGVAMFMAQRLVPPLRSEQDVKEGH
jgi:hypothetical protein